ncbi:uncharacterized protein LOC127858694 [Dreissena polymorpha]|uniref:Fibrinogen C-terminal domain-containing protein n=1 Tax=Dreissena polymorpha TaxID=45954 RepID=A0A9D4BNM4_DREPO|nr:uncharacterized protein LOC127858694 [Dreissena polymorpha]KAH3710596.1 hypothetical protein DPMN_070084 [Dreissena polymorpha]
MEQRVAELGLQLVVICVFITCTVGSSVCLSCQDVFSPAVCNKVKTCGPHEECYSDAFTSPNGYIHFNLGCRDTRLCTGQASVIGKRAMKDSTANMSPLLGRRDQNNYLCSQCCQGDLCNHRLCGQTPFSNDMGPVCYACKLQATQNSCSNITHCNKDQVCQLSVMHDENLQQTVFTTSCNGIKECEVNKEIIRNTASLFGVSTGTHDLDCLVNCCNSNLCNKCVGNTTVGSATTSISSTTRPPTATVSTYSPTTKTSVLTTTVSTTSTRTTISTVAQTPASSTTQQSSTYPFAMPVDCKDISDNKGKYGYHGTGVYTIKLAVSGRTLSVYCDMDTVGGGWTIFQRRFSNIENFNRTFHEYEQGFGDINGEFWLGLANVREMLGDDGSLLKVAYNFTESGSTFEQTDTLSGFRLGPSPYYKRYFNSQTYDEQLKSAGSFTVNKGIEPEYHNGSRFVTHDRDNQANCGSLFGTGNWFADCTCRSEFTLEIIPYDVTPPASCSSEIPLNCRYEPGCSLVDLNASLKTQSPGVGIHLKEDLVPLSSTMMMFRRS